MRLSWTEDEAHPQTCVTCHDPPAIGTTTGIDTGIDTDATVRISGDTPPLIAGFTADDVGRGAICDICGDCHGFQDGTFLQNGIQDVLTQLQGLIEAAMLDLMAEQIAAGNAIDLNGQAIADVAAIADLEFGEARGRQAITVTLTDSTVVGPVRMNDVEVMPPTGNAFDIYNVADPNLIKAGWNWNLVNNDGSLGIHNPSFVTQVLVQSVQALDC